MGKRVAIWLILIVYAINLCGSMVETGCCHNESGLPSDEDSHCHVVSKAQVAVHAFKHFFLLADDSVYSPWNCCCVGGEHQPSFHPSALTRQASTHLPWKSPSAATLLESPHSFQNDVNERFVHPANIFASNVLQCLHATVLLI
ncbi:hypothetical protein [Desulfomonile tiedjei]|uniref:Uncharacterized protein n=1 Tax=Desulfomonile tiedjei (strain ATCC 49306 / DSM 6799 / DCB-1) TaxID=706587 RepID=I4C1P6_DESTA|nr:hypothetical protein [Desulfomonile tiedjei]AFM23487.1 hypothetical protein Desti_0762 [Desulfomonile tiedjei DSM 6799]